MYLFKHLVTCFSGGGTLPFRPAVSVQLDDLIPLGDRPDSIGPHVGGRALPVPRLHRNLPGLTIVGFNVFDGFTGHPDLHVYKLGPAQRELGKQVSGKTEQRGKGLGFHSGCVR